LIYIYIEQLGSSFVHTHYVFYIFILSYHISERITSVNCVDNPKLYKLGS